MEQSGGDGHFAWACGRHTEWAPHRSSTYNDWLCLRYSSNPSRFRRFLRRPRWRTRSRGLCLPAVRPTVRAVTPLRKASDGPRCRDDGCCQPESDVITNESRLDRVGFATERQTAHKTLGPTAGRCALRKGHTGAHGSSASAERLRLRTPVIITAGRCNHRMLAPLLIVLIWQLLLGHTGRDDEGRKGPWRASRTLYLRSRARSPWFPCLQV